MYSHPSGDNSTFTDPKSVAKTSKISVGQAKDIPITQTHHSPTQVLVSLPPCLSFKGLPTDSCCPFLMCVCLLVPQAQVPMCPLWGHLLSQTRRIPPSAHSPGSMALGPATSSLPGALGSLRKENGTSRKKLQEKTAACLLRLFLRGQCTATVRNSQQPHPESCQMLLQISMILRPWSLFLPCQIYWITSAK